MQQHTMPVPNSPLWTLPEVRQTLRVSRRLVFDLLASGDLPNLKIGRRRLVHVDDLTAFIQKAREAR
jgi:excisionase family DNA binding protein